MAKRALSGLIFLMVACGAAHAQMAPDVDGLKKRLSPSVRANLAVYQKDASGGDYQAMRNLAYIWSTDAARETRDASIVGCAWYALILQRHSSRAHAGDQSNKDLYCGRLTSEQARSAGALLAQMTSSPTQKEHRAGVSHD